MRRPKVRSRMRPGCAPCKIRCATRWASVLVLPVPAPAMTSKGGVLNRSPESVMPKVTADFWAGFRSSRCEACPVANLWTLCSTDTCVFPVIKRCNFHDTVSIYSNSGNYFLVHTVPAPPACSGRSMGTAHYRDLRKWLRSPGPSSLRPRRAEHARVAAPGGAPQPA
jgi:hypothetical protein